MQAIFEPQMDKGSPYHVWMGDFSKSAVVLAANINRLMEGSPALESNPKLSRRAKIGIGSVARIRNSQTDITLDTLTKLAEAFDLQPWQLLVPGLDPKNLPVLRNLSPQEAELYERLRSVIIERDSGMGGLE